MRKRALLIIIIVASLITHFLFFGQPRETVFDEVHFGKFISGYFTHEYFFDIHPPLGKLLISGMGYITGFEPGFSFAEIGQQFPDWHYLWLRLLPTIAGALLPIVIYFLIQQLGMSQLGEKRASVVFHGRQKVAPAASRNDFLIEAWPRQSNIRLAAFAGGMFIVLENALLVQSRFILLDSFLLLFGFSALLFYFLYQNNARHSMTYRWESLFLSGLLAALAVSVKWTGLTFLAIIGILYLVNWVKSSRKLRGLMPGIVCLIFTPLVVYFSIFALHFSLLNKSGPGDAFMTPEFRKTLIGSTDSKNTDIKTLNTFQKFSELNFQMYRSNATLTAGHPYSSKWYTWPFMIRPIYYWNDSEDNRQSRIYFFGNPVIWWTSTVAIIYLLINLITALIKNVRHRISDILLDIRPVEMMLSGAFILNLLPFIGIRRAMFLYHYLIGLIFAIIALALLIDQTKNKKRIFAILLTISLATFIFFSPLTYGLPLSEKAYHLRTWFDSWL